VANAHTVDEYVELEEVVAATKVVALTLCRWCGGGFDGSTPTEGPALDCSAWQFDVAGIPPPGGRPIEPSAAPAHRVRATTLVAATTLQLDILVDVCALATSPGP